MAEHPNVGRIRTGYDAFAKGDMDTIKELFADDIVWHVSGGTPLAGEYKGQDEVFAFFGKLFQEFESFSQEIHDILANDEHAAVLLKTTVSRGGTEVSSNEVHIFHIDPNGKTTEFWEFPNFDSAKEVEKLFD